MDCAERNVAVSCLGGKMTAGSHQVGEIYHRLGSITLDDGMFIIESCNSEPAIVRSLRTISLDAFALTFGDRACPHEMLRS
jgi:hypothetical protein